MSNYDILSRCSDGQEVAVCAIEASSWDDVMSKLNNPMGFVAMMDIDVSSVRDSSGKIKSVEGIWSAVGCPTCN